MKTAVCQETCYDSSASQLYEKGKTYEIDEANKWLNSHFGGPKLKKKGDDQNPEPAKGGDPEDTAGAGDGDAAGKGKGGKGGKKAPGSLE